MRRVSLPLLLLLCLVAGVPDALAAVPRDGRYEGRSDQETRDGRRVPVAFSITREGSAVKAISFPSSARCGRDGSKGVFRVRTASRRLALLVDGRIRLRGTLSGRVSERLRFKAAFRMDGRFPTRRTARGTWRLRAELRDRRDRLVAVCRTGTVRWRAARL